MAFSFGADILLKVINEVKPYRTIIIDGGILGPDFVNMTLDEEIKITKKYILENNLNMNPSTIQRLLEIKYRGYKDIFSNVSVKNTLLILSDSPKEVFNYKESKVRDNVNFSIKTIFMENTTHDLIIEKPIDIAQAISEFLK